MPGFPVPFVKFREDDANGFPLAGGKLYSYAAGTSTPLATFTTQALTPGTENLNPTILDASGRAQIWIQDGVGYKFVLTDALGNIIWTVDDVEVPQIQAPPAAAVVPPGTIAMFGGIAAPTGWLLCDGSAVSRFAPYNDLYDVIQERYGPGDGATTMNVPQFQQRFPLGLAVTGTGSTLGGSGGAIDHKHAGPSHTHTSAAHKHTITHTHTVSRIWTPGTAVITSAAPDHLLTAQPGGSGGVFTPDNDQVTTGASVADTGEFTLTTDAGGTADTGTANPAFLVVNFIIKY